MKVERNYTIQAYASGGHISLQNYNDIPCWVHDIKTLPSEKIQHLEMKQMKPLLKSRPKTFQIEHSVDSEVMGFEFRRSD